MPFDRPTLPALNGWLAGDAAGNVSLVTARLNLGSYSATYSGRGNDLPSAATEA